MPRARQIATAACAAAIAALAATAASSDGAQAPGPTQYVLKVGDSFRVHGAAIGCRVTRRGGRPTIECKRGGRAKGTYGSFLDAKRLRVARFRDNTTAQTILTARHGGSWRACATSSTARATEAARCR
jgi:hypothetical protein